MRLINSGFTNETLPSVALSFIPQGGATTYMTVTLTNARVALIHQLTEGGAEFVDVSFTCQTIQGAWIDPSVTTQDNWAAPTV